ncbi:MAG TPA: hypothetical protein VIZ60_10620 [Rubrobacter sp.]
MPSVAITPRNRKTNIIPMGIRRQNSDWRFGMTTGEIAFMNLPTDQG